MQIGRLAFCLESLKFKRSFKSEVNVSLIVNFQIFTPSEIILLLICIDGLEENSELCRSAMGKMLKWRLIQISACSVLVKLKQFIFLLLTIPPFSDCGNVI